MTICKLWVGENGPILVLSCHDVGRSFNRLTGLKTGHKNGENEEFKWGTFECVLIDNA